MRKVLVIDDEAYVARLLRPILKQAWQEDVEVDHATDGAIGKIRAASGGYDLITLDLNMPLMGGLEALAEIKRSPKAAGIPIIVITGVHDRDLPQKASDLGAVATIFKPFAVEDLRRAIEAAGLSRPAESPETGRSQP